MKVCQHCHGYVKTDGTCAICGRDQRDLKEREAARERIAVQLARGEKGPLSRAEGSTWNGGKHHLPDGSLV